MLDQLTSNTVVHLKFFARSRLLLALAVIVVAMTAVGVVPALLMSSAIGRFEQLRMLVSMFASTTLLLTSSLGLLAAAAHIRGRTVRMVLTRPCLPEVWLASIFIAGVLVIAALHLLMAIATIAASLAWGVPYQTGFAFIAVDAFCRALIWFGWATALGVAFHPVVAALVALFFNEGTLYGVKFIVASSAQASGGSWPFAVMGRVADAVYMAVPMVTPFAQKTEDIYSSLRTVRSDWVVLVQIMGYTVLAMAFFFCVSDLILRRRPLA